MVDTYGDENRIVAVVVVLDGNNGELWVIQDA
jgi:hypothetical protein